MTQLLDFFITNAYADTPAIPAQGPQGGGMSLFIIFAVFFVFMYFGIWRPQSRRAKEQRNMIGALAKGDEVMTSGGLLGRVTKMTDQYIALTVANNVEILMQKASVVSVLPKGTLKSIE